MALLPVDATQKNEFALFGTNDSVLGPWGTLRARRTSRRRRPRSSTRRCRASTYGAKVEKTSLEDAGITTKLVGFDPNATDLTGPLTAAGAQTADIVVPQSNAAGLRQRREDARAARRRRLEDRLEPALPQRRGRGGPRRRPRPVDLRHRLDPGRRQDRPGRRAVQQGDGEAQAAKLAPDAWVIVSWGQVLTTVKMINKLGVANAHPGEADDGDPGFKGPQALGAPSLHCGKYKTEPAACNDQAQFFQYQGARRVQAPHRLAPAAGELHPRGLARRSPCRGGAAPHGPASGRRRSDRAWTGTRSSSSPSSGLGAGSLIAGIAIGVVLTYRGSGIINLATGAIAMLAGYCYWSLKAGESRRHAPTAPALADHVRRAPRARRADRVRRLPAAADGVAAREARGVARRAAGRAGVGLARVRHRRRSRSRRCCRGAPSTVFGSTVPDRPLHPAGDRPRRDARPLARSSGSAASALATRAASENEVGAMLLGLSPNQLALANTLLATLVAGGLGVLAASITQLDPTSLPLQVVPALAAALFANFTSFWIAALVGLAIGMLENILYYLQTFSWFPTDNGVAMPGVQPLLVFVLMVSRCSSAARTCRAAASWSSSGCRSRRAPSGWADRARRGGGRGRRADRPPLRLPPGADHLAAGDDHVPLARRHHRLRRPDLRRPARARRRLRASSSPTSPSTTASASRGGC